MKKKENSELGLTTVTADEFEFILNDMRLKQKTIVLNSNYSRNTFWIDLNASRENNKPVKTYWTEILINLIGEIPFQTSRNNYKYYLENLCK